MKNFPAQYQELNAWMEKLGAAIHGPMAGFSQLHEKTIEKGALDSKTKKLNAANRGEPAVFGNFMRGNA